jgi:hypothetical protein
LAAFGQVHLIKRSLTTARADNWLLKLGPFGTWLHTNLTYLTVENTVTRSALKVDFHQRLLVGWLAGGSSIAVFGDSLQGTREITKYPMNSTLKLPTESA